MSLCRCLADEKCVGYKNQHNGTLPINCLLIHCLDTDQHGFESDETGITFEKGEQIIEVLPSVSG